MSANGDIMVGEMRLRTLMEARPVTAIVLVMSIGNGHWAKPLRARVKRLQRFALKPVMNEESALVQMQQLQLKLTYQQLIAAGIPLPSYRDVGFRVFSDADEDGILLYLLSVVGSGDKHLVDLGAAGVAASNSANLIINHGWTGLLIEGNVESIAAHRAEYELRDVEPPTLVNAWIDADNIDQLITEHSPKDVDLLSIDIDGNDYWVWKAIDSITPRIVVVEYQDILGPDRSVTVPYDPKFSVANYPENATDNNYVGASLRALVKLGASKGYRLVATNLYGFNAFFVRQDLAPDALPEIPVEAGLRHPLNEYGMRERWPLVAHLPWVEV